MTSVVLENKTRLFARKNCSNDDHFNCSRHQPTKRKKYPHSFIFLVKNICKRKSPAMFCNVKIFCFLFLWMNVDDSFIHDFFLYDSSGIESKLWKISVFVSRFFLWDSREVEPRLFLFLWMHQNFICRAHLSIFVMILYVLWKSFEIF